MANPFVTERKADLAFWQEQLKSDPANATNINVQIQQSQALLAKAEADAAASDARARAVIEGTGDTAAQPSVEQAADTASPLPAPQAASGESTALTEDEIKSNEAQQAEITHQNFQGNQDAVAQRSQAAYLAEADSIGGLTPNQNNATPDSQGDPSQSAASRMLAADGIGQNPSDAGTMAQRSEANYPQETDDLSAKTANDKPIGTANSKEPFEKNISENQLHAFASYTYNLSLHALSPDDYKSLLADPKQRYVPTNVLIAGAGRRSGENTSGMQRSKHFSEDFFFDKLDFETIIGWNARSKNANVMNINFTIIEPYGMTLLNRLLQQSVITKGNYLQIPYLLQIDFFGYDDVGNPQKIENITKYIPIKIATMGMKVSQKGAEYNISAYPFNHQAFAESVATNPIKLTVTAETVNDFFEAIIAQPDSEEPTGVESTQKVTDVTNQTAGVNANIAYYNNIIRDNNAKLNETTSDESGDHSRLTPAERTEVQKQNEALTDAINKLSKSIPTDVVVRSYTSAINTWLRQPVLDNKAKYYDQIRFVIDPDIGKATFPDKNTINKLSRAMSLPGASEKGNKSNLKDGEKPQSNVAINQGASILDVVDLAIKNSSYVYEQILNVFKPDLSDITDEDLKKLLEPMKWFKVIPQIELKEYDESTNSFSKLITYHIVRSTLYNTKSEDAPQGKPRHYVKDYQYIFTGKNNDILNFDLKFDTLYFTVIPGNPAIKDGTNQSAAKVGSESPKNDKASKELRDEQIKKFVNDRLNGNAALQPKKIFTAPLPGNTANDDSIAESIKRVSKNILTTSAGDMIEVDLKIIGDPDFIKQDDVFYRPGATTIEDGVKTWNGSLVTDDEELFVRLMFNTPGDYNELGLAWPNEGEYTANAFSGFYKVIKVKSNFAQGKFEQNLTLIRYANQPTEGVTSASGAASEVARDEFGPGFDAEVARQTAMNGASSVGNAAAVVTSTPSAGTDIPTASIDPTESSAYNAMKEGVGPEASGLSNTISDMTGTNVIDVDANNGKIGEKQTNTFSEEDMSGVNPYASVINAPTAPISGSSDDGTISVAAEVVPTNVIPTGSISSKNVAIDKIQNQILDNTESLSKANDRLNTYPIDSAEWRDAKREVQMYSRNNQNLADNLKTVKAEKDALLNG